ncbi:MAG: hypothetical protein KF819_29865 [Labilithrix sp.]|nr:hypothetical protein [Labilithrix sp.]
MRLLPISGSLFAGLVALAACETNEAPKFPLATPVPPGTCADWVGQPVERTCIPRIAKADAPLVLEIEERCGVCGSTAERCTVTLDGRTVTLSLDGKTCEPPVGAVCPELCGKNRVRCQIPPLLEGRYDIRYNDTSGRTDILDVRVEHDAATRCALDDPHNGG